MRLVFVESLVDNASYSAGTHVRGVTHYQIETAPLSVSAKKNDPHIEIQFADRPRWRDCIASSNCQLPLACMSVANTLHCWTSLKPCVTAKIAATGTDICNLQTLLLQMHSAKAKSRAAINDRLGVWPRNKYGWSYLKVPRVEFLCVPQRYATGSPARPPLYDCLDTPCRAASSVAI